MGYVRDEDYWAESSESEKSFEMTSNQQPGPFRPTCNGGGGPGKRQQSHDEQLRGKNSSENRLKRNQNKVEEKNTPNKIQWTSHLAPDWAKFPDQNWRPNRNIRKRKGEGEGGKVSDDGSSDDDHLDHGDDSKTEEAGPCDKGDVKGYYYDREKYRPRRDRTTGSLVYSSFIPPIPSKRTGNVFVAKEQEVQQETEEETMARIIEKMKNTKFFEVDQPAPMAPNQAFAVKFLGVTAQSYVMLKLMDMTSQAQYKHVEESLAMYFNSKSVSKNIKMPIEEMEPDRIVLTTVNDSKYIRAMIVKVNHEERTVFLRNCDEWEHMTVPVGSISYMHPGFMEVPFLVQKCKIKGFEFWQNTRVLNEITPLVPAVDDYMRVIECEVDDDGILVVELDAKIKAGKIETGATLNKMFNHVIRGFTRIPAQFTRGVIVEKAHVTIIENNGEVWIHMHSALSAKLASIGENPPKRYTRHPELWGVNDPVSTFEHSYYNLKNKRFLAPFEDDKSLYRVEVLEATRGSNKVKVFYLDFGNTQMINIEDLTPTEFVDPILNDIPPQVFRGFLHGIDRVVDADEFFELFGVSVVQRMVIAGFHEPFVPNLEVYAQLDPEKPGEWTFVNQYILEKGIATGPGVKFPMPVGRPRVLRPTTKEKRRSERMRFLSTCRVTDGKLSSTFQLDSSSEN